MATSNKKLTKTIWWSLFILLIIIIIFILTLRKPFVRHTGRIPYGWDSKLNRTLYQYISTVPTRHIVVLTGGYQTGKSRALEEVKYILQRDNSFVIHADFSTARNTNDIIGLIKTAVFTGLAEMNPPIKAQKRFLTKYLPSSNTEVDYGLNPIYSQLYYDLSSKIDLLHDGIIGWSEFFNALEEINPAMQVACLFNSIDNILLYSPKLFDALLSRFALRKDYVDHVPIVCELKDSSLRPKFSLFESSIKIYDVGGVTQPENIFYKKYKIFTQNELKKIVAKFGYHGGIFERIFEDLKHGYHLDEAINSVYDFIKKDIKKLNISDDLRTRVCSNSTVVKPNEIMLYHPLLEKGYIWLKEDSNFNFTHNGIKDLICTNEAQ